MTTSTEKTLTDTPNKSDLEEFGAGLISGYFNSETLSHYSGSEK